MDADLTLCELRRLEAERKLQALPPEILETAWVREAQIEAVTDAVLAVTYACDPAGLAHARQVGEWCARIASRLTGGPDPSFARRAGVLSGLDAKTLALIPELERFARRGKTISRIVAVAAEFDRRVTDFASRCGPSLATAIDSMLTQADEASRPIVKALSRSVSRRRAEASTTIASDALRAEA